MEPRSALFTDGPLTDAATLERELGWTLKREGLCRDEVCVLVPDRAALEHDGGVDLRVAAGLLDRPVAVDEPSGLVAVGAPRAARRAALEDLTAPDFELPDLDGQPHRLSDHRGKKRLLAAFASW